MKTITAILIGVLAATAVSCREEAAYTPPQDAPAGRPAGTGEPQQPQPQQPARPQEPAQPQPRPPQEQPPGEGLFGRVMGPGRAQPEQTAVHGTWVHRTDQTQRTLVLGPDGQFTITGSVNGQLQTIRGTYTVTPDALQIQAEDDPRPMALPYRVVDRDTLQITDPQVGTIEFKRRQ